MDEFLLNTSPENAEKFPFVLLGNKSDLINDYTVGERMIENFCKERNIKYFSVSAKTYDNLEQAIGYIIDKAIERIELTTNKYDDEFDKISLNSNDDTEVDVNKKRCYCI